MVVDALVGLPTAVYILISTLIGGLLSLIGTFAFNWNKRRIEKERLKKALATEIKTVDENLIRKFASDSYEGRPPIEMDDDELAEYTEEEKELVFESRWRGVIAGKFERLSKSSSDKQVYLENLSDIGALSEDQIEAVIRFYEQLDVVQDSVDRVIESSKIDEENDLHLLNYKEELEHLEVESNLLLKLKVRALDELGELEDTDYTLEDMDIDIGARELKEQLN